MMHRFGPINNEVASGTGPHELRSAITRRDREGRDETGVEGCKQRKREKGGEETKRRRERDGWQN